MLSEVVVSLILVNHYEHSNRIIPVITYSLCIHGRQGRILLKLSTYQKKNFYVKIYLGAFCTFEMRKTIELVTVTHLFFFVTFHLCWHTRSTNIFTEFQFHRVVSTNRHSVLHIGLCKYLIKLSCFTTFGSNGSPQLSLCHQSTWAPSRPSCFNRQSIAS